MDQTNGTEYNNVGVLLPKTKTLSFISSCIHLLSIHLYILFYCVCICRLMKYGTHSNCCKVMKLFMVFTMYKEYVSMKNILVNILLKNIHRTAK